MCGWVCVRKNGVGDGGVNAAWPVLMGSDAKETGSVCQLMFNPLAPQASTI